MWLFQTGMSSVVMETPKKLGDYIVSRKRKRSRAENDSLSDRARRITTFCF